MRASTGVVNREAIPKRRHAATVDDRARALSLYAFLFMGRDCGRLLSTFVALASEVRGTKWHTAIAFLHDAIRTLSVVGYIIAGDSAQSVQLWK